MYLFLYASPGSSEFDDVVNGSMLFVFSLSYHMWFIFQLHRQGEEPEHREDGRRRPVPLRPGHEEPRPQGHVRGRQGKVVMASWRVVGCPHSNRNAVMVTKFLSLYTPEVFILTIVSAVIDDNFVNKTTFRFQCLILYRCYRGNSACVVCGTETHVTALMLLNAQQARHGMHLFNWC